MVFPVVLYGCESWTIKKAECRRIDAFELWCWRRFLRVPWTARRSNQSILKEISPEYSLEGLMLKLKLQYLGHLMWRTNSLEKTLMLGKIEGRSRRGRQRMRWLNDITDSTDMSLSKLLGVGDGQGSLVCPWGRKELDRTEQLNWTQGNNKVFPVGSVVKNPPVNAGHAGLIPGLGRSAGEGNSHTLQYSCLKNLMDSGAWWATVHGVTNSQTWLSMHVCTNLNIIYIMWENNKGFPGGSVVKNPPANAGEAIWLLGWKILWRRKNLPTPVFLPGKSYGQMILMCYSPLSHKIVRQNLANENNKKITHLTSHSM